MKVVYRKGIEDLMQTHYACLPEKERRHYAAQEALKLGYGGQSYLKRLLGVDHKTIRTGQKEQSQLTSGELIDCKGERIAGGGRKKTAINTELKDQLLSFIEHHKAGSPTQSGVYWICHRPTALAQMFYEESGQVVSHGSLKRLLRELGYGFRKQSKQLATGNYRTSLVLPCAQGDGWDCAGRL